MPNHSQNVPYSNKYNSFVKNGTLSVEILRLEVQICCHLQSKPEPWRFGLSKLLKCSQKFCGLINIHWDIIQTFACLAIQDISRHLHRNFLLSAASFLLPLCVPFMSSISLYGKDKFCGFPCRINYIYVTFTNACSCHVMIDSGCQGTSRQRANDLTWGVRCSC